MTIKVIGKTKSKGFSARAALKPHTGPQTGLTLLSDVQDGSYLVTGQDGAGAATDISALGVLAVTTDAPTICSADAPTGMAGTIHGLLPGTANLTFTVTMNDGTGPFVFTVVATVTTSPTTGLNVTFGSPVVRP